MSRRDELLDAVTDQVVASGLIGLTLRPLAAAVGTSDRMLIYHFGSHDDLVSAVVRRVGERSVAGIDALAPARTVRQAVLQLWEAYQAPPLRDCLSTYVQAAATGLIGREPHLSEARASNDQWAEALKRYFLRSGASQRRVGRVVGMVDSALFGFTLDLITDRPGELRRGVADLADAAHRLAEGR
ncbi:MAG: TetR/AcrR family transcriptional regulator [Nocardioides sp.]